MPVLVRRAVTLGIACTAIAGGVGPLTAAAGPHRPNAQGSTRSSHRRLGRLRLRLEPCCSTLPVRSGEQPKYGPRLVKWFDPAGNLVAKKMVETMRWVTLKAPVGRYELTAAGCRPSGVAATDPSTGRVLVRFSRKNIRHLAEDCPVA